MAKKVKCRNWLIQKVVRDRTPPQQEQEWILKQVTKPSFPVPDRNEAGSFL
jgi:hypothetical protein